MYPRLALINGHVYRSMVILWLEREKMLIIRGINTISAMTKDGILDITVLWMVVHL